MTGQELFELYISKRDYSGSEEDRYVETLRTIWSNIFYKLYPLLEDAEAQGKKLDIKTVDHGHPLLNDELNEDDIILV